MGSRGRRTATASLLLPLLVAVGVTVAAVVVDAAAPLPRSAATAAAAAAAPPSQNKQQPPSAAAAAAARAAGSSNGTTTPASSSPAPAFLLPPPHGGGGGGDNSGPFAFALSGSGSLYYYYIGVLMAFAQRSPGLLTAGATPIGGISGGAAVAALTCAGVPLKQQIDVLVNPLAACRFARPNDPVCGFQGAQVYAQALAEGIAAWGAPDAAQRCSRGGALRIAVSKLDAASTNLTAATPWLVRSFSSAIDLADAAAASSYIPCLLGLQAFYVYKGAPVYDGGSVTTYQDLCDELVGGSPAAGGGGGRRCVKLSALMIGANNPTGKPATGADCQLPFAAPPPKPAAGAGTNNKVGGSNTAAGAAAPGFFLPQPQPPPRPNGGFTQLPPRFGAIPPGFNTNLPTQCSAFPTFRSAGGPDIFPGFGLNKLAYDPCDWLGLGFAVQQWTPQNITNLVNQGLADGAAWINANGY